MAQPERTPKQSQEELTPQQEEQLRLERQAQLAKDAADDRWRQIKENPDIIGETPTDKDEDKNENEPTLKKDLTDENEGEPIAPPAAVNEAIVFSTDDGEPIAPPAAVSLGALREAAHRWRQEATFIEEELSKAA